jgi:probable selenium-dependent hydroxylase accessory protein YqeC
VTQLVGALGLARGDLVALVGAGGKTTLVYRLAAEARALGLSVLATTTTHMGTLPEAVTGPVFVEAEGEIDAALESALRQEGRATVLGRRIREDKLEGLAPERVEALRRRADLVLVEADGARGRSLKLPAAHEPVVPSRATHVVVLAALDVLGKPLAEDHVHRLELVIRATGCRAGSPVDESVLAAALLHPDGYLSRIPATARAGVFLNKAEDPAAMAAAERIARGLVPPYAFVAAGSAREGKPRLWAMPPARGEV